MNIDRYTEKMQNALMEAQNIALENGNQSLELEHLNYALVSQMDGLIPRLLQTMDIDLESFRRDSEALVNKLPKVSGSGSDNLYAGSGLNRVLAKAEKKAQEFKDEYVSVEHIYLSMLEEGSGPIADLFRKYQITTMQLL